MPADGPVQSCLLLLPILLLILLVDRRRGMGAALGTLAWSGIGFLALNAIPFERQWVADMVVLNPNSPMRVGITMLEVNALVRSIGSKAALSPAVLLRLIRPWA